MNIRLLLLVGLVVSLPSCMGERKMSPAIERLIAANDSLNRFLENGDWDQVYRLWERSVRAGVRRGIPPPDVAFHGFREYERFVSKRFIKTEDFDTSSTAAITKNSTRLVGTTPAGENIDRTDTVYHYWIRKDGQWLLWYFYSGEREGKGESSTRFFRMADSLGL